MMPSLNHQRPWLETKPANLVLPILNAQRSPPVPDRFYTLESEIGVIHITFVLSCISTRYEGTAHADTQKAEPTAD